MIRIKTLVLIVSITASVAAQAQPDELELTRADLKGIKTLSWVQYAPDSSILSRQQQYVNGLGDIVKTESYHNNELISRTTYTYDNRGNLTYRKHHAQIFSYDEARKDHVGALSEGFFTGEFFIYSLNRLVESYGIRVSEGDTTYNSAVTCSYDNQNRLVRKTEINSLVELAAKPGTNPALMDSLMAAGEAYRFTTVYKNLQDSVTSITSNGRKEIISKTFTRLNANGKPVESRILDPDGTTRITEQWQYNATGKLIRHSRVHSNMETYTDAAPIPLQAEHYQYNAKGLPVKITVREKDELIYFWRVKYQY